MFSSNMSPMTAKKSWVLGADDLATWFLRLNGCLTMVNFVVHGQQRLKPGEFDILAVRFLTAARCYRLTRSSTTTRGC